MVPTPLKPTPVLTEHARQRCREMGLSTKVAKRIVQHADVSYVCHPHMDSDRVIHLSNAHPGIAVVTAPSPDRGMVVVTVLYSDRAKYDARDSSSAFGILAKET